MTMNTSRQKGSIIVYILIAIALTGLLVASMSQGTQKSASSEQIDEVMMYLQNDIQTVQSNITECVTSYQNNNFCPTSGCVTEYATQDTGNLNVPFPGYCATTPACPVSTMTYGNAGTALANIGCPRAPTPLIFNDSITQSLKTFQDTANYTVTYYNNNTEGVYLRITRTASDPLWTEAIARMNSKYAACSVAYVAPGGADPTGYTCTNGCLYYWILRKSSSSASWKTGCP